MINILRTNEIPFPCKRTAPRGGSYDNQIRETFTRHGMKSADIDYTDRFFLTYALTECGRLYLYDGSHGGGQRFTIVAGNYE